MNDAISKLNNAIRVAKELGLRCESELREAVVEIERLHALHLERTKLTDRALRERDAARDEIELKTRALSDALARMDRARSILDKTGDSWNMLNTKDIRVLLTKGNNCPQCDGTGIVRYNDGRGMDQGDCLVCEGAGRC